MLCFTLLSLCICLVKTDQDGQSVRRKTLGVQWGLGQVSLNEMFKEVERLMEDTQQKLEEAVHKMINETSKSLLGDPPSVSYQQQNVSEPKEPGEESRDTLLTTAISQENTWNEVDHECLIDEDCEEDSFCLYGLSSSQCVHCKSTNEECVKDEECCGGQLCVWGVCMQNKTRGESGTICQFQSDCSPLHCCAMHKALLYPVCRPRPVEGQSCYEQPNQLLDLLLWDEEAPHEHCPCGTGLTCKLLGQESLCLSEKN